MQHRLAYLAREDARVLADPANRQSARWSLIRRDHRALFQRGAAIAALLAVSIVGLTFGTHRTRNVFTTVIVASASMEPTLHCSGAPGCRRLKPSEAIVKKVATTAPIARGAIVLLDGRKVAHGCRREALYIKRVIGLAGDSVESRKGVVIINGEFPSSRFPTGRYRSGWAYLGTKKFGPRHVGTNQLFVMGDNRRISCDSRTFGPVPRNAVIGVVVDIR